MLKICQLTVEKEGKALIHNINLELLPGHLYPVIGPNGAGKTTLLKTLAGIINPTLGNILWLGNDLLKKPRKEISKIISFTPHSTLIPFDYTVEQFVGMGLYARDLCHANEGDALLKEALHLVEAQPLRHYSVNKLSQGERQRIFIARALVTQAKIFAFDEPTANVDKKYRALICELMQRLVDQQKIVLIATHDSISIQKHSHEIISLDQGRQI